MEILFQGRPGEALERCDQAVESSTEESARVHRMNRCHILNSLGRHAESDHLLERLVTGDPKNHRLLHNWAAVKRMLGRHSVALEMFETERQMLSVGGDQLSIAANLYELGKTNCMLGNIEDAFAYANRCLLETAKCDDPIMHGCAYRLLGDLYHRHSVAIALSCYNEAIEHFSKGMDPRAVDDVKERIAAVQSGRDPSEIS